MIAWIASDGYVDAVNFGHDPLREVVQVSFDDKPFTVLGNERDQQELQIYFHEANVTSIDSVQPVQKLQTDQVRHYNFFKP